MRRRKHDGHCAKRNADSTLSRDRSLPATLDLASRALAELTCPVILERRDYVEALRDYTERVDVVWIGYSLHHLRASAKLAFMREIRGVVGDDGVFLMCEPASPDDEDRSAWLRRYERLNQPLWTALTPEEWDAVMTHVRAADFPENELSLACAWSGSWVQRSARGLRSARRPSSYVLPQGLKSGVQLPSTGNSELRGRAPAGRVD